MHGFENQGPLKYDHYKAHPHYCKNFVCKPSLMAAALTGLIAPSYIALKGSYLRKSFTLNTSLSICDLVVLCGLQSATLISIRAAEFWNCSGFKPCMLTCALLYTASYKLVLKMYR